MAVSPAADVAAHVAATMSPTAARVTYSLLAPGTASRTTCSAGAAPIHRTAVTMINARAMELLGSTLVSRLQDDSGSHALQTCNGSWPLCEGWENTVTATSY